MEEYTAQSTNKKISLRLYIRCNWRGEKDHCESMSKGFKSGVFCLKAEPKVNVTWDRYDMFIMFTSRKK